MTRWLPCCRPDAPGLNDYAEHYKAIYPIAARCGVFAKSDIQPLINEGATRRTWPPPFSRPWSIRPSAVWPAAKPIRGNVAF
ncbi:MAG: hypothetical protein ACLR0U_29035 [Enterocloster clostridioformis]